MVGSQPYTNHTLNLHQIIYIYGNKEEECMRLAIPGNNLVYG
jgi:hypothetical protein